MNLIEKYGSYDAAKAKQQELSKIAADPQLLLVGKIIKEIGEIEIALLEYRRQHNIFESEDKIVVKNDCLIDFADLTLNLKVLTVLMMTDEGFIRSIEAAGLFKSSLVRHATEEEIKAGKRLEVK